LIKLENPGKLYVKENKKKKKSKPGHELKECVISFEGKYTKKPIHL